MAKHWTQTPEGKERMSQITIARHKDGIYKRKKKSKAEIVVAKVVKSKPKQKEITPIDVNLFMEIINKLLR